MDDFRIGVLNRSFYSNSERGKQRYLNQRRDHKVTQTSAHLDQQLQDDANKVLCKHPEIDSHKIEIVVENGVVFLFGEVTDRPVKKLVEQIIDDIIGIRDIQNRLTITESDSPAFRYHKGSSLQEDSPS